MMMKKSEDSKREQAISNESMCIFCCVLIEKVKEAWRAVCLTVFMDDIVFDRHFMH
jgi:hypothetical protein